LFDAFVRDRPSSSTGASIHTLIRCRILTVGDPGRATISSLIRADLIEVATQISVDHAVVPDILRRLTASPASSANFFLPSLYANVG